MEASQASSDAQLFRLFGTITSPVPHAPKHVVTGARCETAEDNNSIGEGGCRTEQLRSNAALEFGSNALWQGNSPKEAATLPFALH